MIGLALHVVVPYSRFLECRDRRQAPLVERFAERSRQEAAGAGAAASPMKEDDALDAVVGPRGKRQAADGTPPTDSDTNGL